jgi:hypothetical protein
LYNPIKSTVKTYNNATGNLLLITTLTFLQITDLLEDHGKLRDTASGKNLKMPSSNTKKKGFV